MLIASKVDANIGYLFIYLFEKIKKRTQDRKNILLEILIKSNSVFYYIWLF